ncbi:hypothetical protein CATMQ487_01380 [Sphaerotilus microaerophilus]|uniref:Calcineurin-like phosphoesterase domain-containing protein n=1 Tax=Sphaerotilus microaerophilus TaxID=2914710 RepID=A0ABN6PHH6_9BURK|nr:hypothetical protein CATMQ487_01380 [Sphaerotilus sp. FB-5]
MSWYAPIGLRQIAQQQLWSTQLLHNLDRRETFHGPFELIDLRDADTGGGFGFDFVADTGDGGCPTYAVARGLLAPELVAEGAAAPLPEGRLLILGGDLAYPAASPEGYQSRLVEMFELARDGRSRFRPVAGDLPADAPFAPDQKLVAAIPQNHDWFDSASTFCRYFVHDEKAGLVGARAPQTRSYFGIALPHDWFVLGFDFALTGDLDRQQFEAFGRLVTSGQIPRGAQLVLIYPEPYWTRPFASLLRAAYPLRFQRFEHLCAEHGLHVRLRLAGDLHHYVRERLAAAPPVGLSCDLVTCGSGGAFGHATHCVEVTEPKVLQWASEPDAVPEELRGRIVLGRVRDAAQAAGLGLCVEPAASTCPAPGDAVPPAAPVCYPDQATSHRQARGNVLALLRPRGERWWASNLAFALLIGVLLQACSGLLAPWLPWPALLQGLAGVALLFTALMLTTDNDPARAGRAERAWGGVLGALLLALAAVLGWGLAPLRPALAAPGAPGVSLLPVDGLRVLVFGLGSTALAVLAGALGVGAFLWLLSCVAGRAVTNTSSALSLQGHKGFLRFRVHAGGLEAVMLGCDEVPQRWVPRHERSAEGLPWWEPAPGEPPLRWRVVDRFEAVRSLADAGIAGQDTAQAR